MNELWSDKNKEKLSDIDPDNFDEACDMAYNLHEDFLVLKEENTQLKARNARLEEERDELLAHLECVTSTSNSTTFSVYAKKSLNKLRVDAIKQMVDALQDPNYPPMMFDKQSIDEYIDQLRNNVKDDSDG